MGDTGRSAAATAAVGFEKHAPAVGAAATLASAISSPFMSGDYRIFGFIFAGINIVLTCVVASHKLITLEAKTLRILVVVLAVATAGSLGALYLSYIHPPAPPAAPAVSAQPALPAPVVRESHDTYTSTTTGKNSPVINGTTAPIQIGDNPDPPPAKKNEKGR